MAGNIESLFDPQRRKAVRDAIRQGKDIFSGRAQTEPAISADDSGPSRSLSAELLMSDPPRFRVGKQTYSPNSFLMLAIQCGDLASVISAVKKGADVNHQMMFLPVSPDCDSEHPARISDASVKNPLQYAQKLGKAEIAEFLKQNGAR
jgi:hypothetical protein